MNRYLKAKIIERYGSQFAFAHHLGLHESHVSKIVRRKLSLSAKDQRRWAKALGCKAEDLFNA